MTGRTTQPNILLLMADQYRFDYLGVSGAAFARTPNLDRLARSGMLFSNCTTNAPLCAPARISLATGMLPCRNEGPLDNNQRLHRDAITYYQRLRDVGYRVGCVGKLDLDKPEKPCGLRGNRRRTYRYGFTHPVECEGKKMMASPDRPIGPYGAYLSARGLFEGLRDDYRSRRDADYLADVERGCVLPLRHYHDCFVGRRAIDWIRRAPAGEPWHLFVSFVGPHDPFDPPREYSEGMHRVDVPAPTQTPGSPAPSWLDPFRRSFSPAHIRKMRRQYCALIELIDDQVGKILDAVGRRGMLSNTYVLFCSDHGEMLGDRGLYTKYVPYEASVRVPLIASGPDIPQGSTSDTLVELMDLNPTICDLAGLAKQPDIDGRSFRDTLRAPRTEHRTDAVSMLWPFGAIRTRTHKLIRATREACVELYDLQHDPGESRNIVHEHPSLVNELQQKLDSRLRGVEIAG
ncbi:MAG: sulfatase family protein [Planctomycetota bacterium]|jgi:choline-sulfatase